MESSTWLVIWRASMVCVSSRMRSASVDLPWSTWAMMLKLRRRDWGVLTMGRGEYTQGAAPTRLALGTCCRVR